MTKMINGCINDETQTRQHCHKGRNNAIQAYYAGAVLSSHLRRVEKRVET